MLYAPLANPHKQARNQLNKHPIPKAQAGSSQTTAKKEARNRSYECPSREHHCNVNRGRVGWPGAKG